MVLVMVSMWTVTHRLPGLNTLFFAGRVVEACSVAGRHRATESAWKATSSCATVPSVLPGLGHVRLPPLLGCKALQPQAPAVRSSAVLPAMMDGPLSSHKPKQILPPLNCFCHIFCHHEKKKIALYCAFQNRVVVVCIPMRLCSSEGNRWRKLLGFIWR